LKPSLKNLKEITEEHLEEERAIHKIVLQHLKRALHIHEKILELSDEDLRKYMKWISSHPTAKDEKKFHLELTKIKNAGTIILHEIRNRLTVPTE